MKRRFSWTLLDDGRAVKHLGYTSFKDQRFVIPKGFYEYFNIKDESTSLFLVYQSEKFELKIRRERSKYLVITIWWGSELDDIIKEKFPKWKNIKQHERSMNMWMLFEKTNKDNLFKVDFIKDSTPESEKIIFEDKVSRILKNLPGKRPQGSKKLKRKKIEVELITRNPYVQAWVLENSNWECEKCDKAAPFSKNDGKKYLEIHHIKRLADGGSDTTENAIAVCPDCHRELHYGADKNILVEELLKKISRLKKE